MLSGFLQLAGAHRRGQLGNGESRNCLGRRCCIRCCFCYCRCVAVTVAVAVTALVLVLVLVLALVLVLVLLLL